VYSHLDLEAQAVALAPVKDISNRSVVGVTLGL
jgi:hypothetical protein